MKLAEKKNDKDFVNLHKTDTKRKFRDLQNFTEPFGVKCGLTKQEISQSNSQENLRNHYLNSNEETGRKILTIKSANPNFVQNNSNCSLVSDEELEKLINQVIMLNSREEIKIFLRHLFISMYF